MDPVKTDCDTKAMESEAVDKIPTQAMTNITLKSKAQNEHIKQTEAHTLRYNRHRLELFHAEACRLKRVETEYKEEYLERDRIYVPSSCKPMFFSCRPISFPTDNLYFCNLSTVTSLIVKENSYWSLPRVWKYNNGTTVKVQ